MMADSDDEDERCECFQEVLKRLRINAMNQCMQIIENAASIDSTPGRVDTAEAMCLVASITLEVLHRAHGDLETRLAALAEIVGVVRAGVIVLDGRIHEAPAGYA